MNCPYVMTSVMLSLCPKVYIARNSSKALFHSLSERGLLFLGVKLREGEELLLSVRLYTDSLSGYSSVWKSTYLSCQMRSFNLSGSLSPARNPLANEALPFVAECGD